MLPQHLSILVLREDGGFVGYCPELSLSTDKQATEEEAHSILREGIALMFEAADLTETKPRRRSNKTKSPSKRKLPAQPRATASAPKKTEWLM